MLTCRCEPWANSVLAVGSPEHVAAQEAHGSGRDRIRDGQSWSYPAHATVSMGPHGAETVAKQAQSWVPTPSTARSSPQNPRAHWMSPYLCLLVCSREVGSPTSSGTSLELLSVRTYHLHQLRRPAQVCAARSVSQKPLLLRTSLSEV